VVGQRLVSVGAYVARGTKVASVMRTNPLRVNLTVPEQYSTEVAIGRPVSLEVDAAPGKTFEGQVRYVSPALQSDSRTLIVEALVANDSGVLKPGSFATARIEQGSERPGVLVPKAAVRTVSGTSRVYVISGERTEERIVTVGQSVDDLVEITTGLKAGENVATSNVEKLSDGSRVTTQK
jgi:membrane fusion protein (multidrug efflux system)